MTEALYPKKQYPAWKGSKPSLKTSPSDPEKRKPEQFVDFTFIKELDQSGTSTACTRK
jgi:hypothetical protein